MKDFLTSCKVLTYGLSKQTSENTLLEVACRFGKVHSVKVVNSKNRPSGSLGIITFTHQKAAEAIVSVGAVMIDGHRCKIQRAGLTRKPTNKHTDQKSALCKVYIGGFNKNLTEDELKSLFVCYGPIDRVVINRDATSKHSKGSGFVFFQNAKIAHTVSQLKIQELGGYRMIVLPCTKESSKFKSKTTKESKESLSSSSSVTQGYTTVAQPIFLISPVHEENNLRFNVPRVGYHHTRSVIYHSTGVAHSPTSSIYPFNPCCGF